MHPKDLSPDFIVVRQSPVASELRSGWAWNSVQVQVQVLFACVRCTIGAWTLNQIPTHRSRFTLIPGVSAEIVSPSKWIRN